jgi:hypothetical protein
LFPGRDIVYNYKYETRCLKEWDRRGRGRGGLMEEKTKALTMATDSRSEVKTGV